ncbi:hypothetical protein BC833DRAFT_262845 [Globomyces pollinis-pini]|nr:hypothetical protein BC833DRAFT_262845 [Globomyces pollinis-pini]
MVDTPTNYAIHFNYAAQFISQLNSSMLFQKLTPLESTALFILNSKMLESKEQYNVDDTPTAANFLSNLNLRTKFVVVPNTYETTEEKMLKYHKQDLIALNLKKEINFRISDSRAIAAAIMKASTVVSNTIHSIQTPIFNANLDHFTVAESIRIASDINA